jgi:hypothetical protein
MARRPLFDTLRDLRGGVVIEDLEAKLQELVTQVQITNGSGTLELKLTVSPLKGSSEAVVVKDDIKLKAPQIKSSGTVMFPTPEGNVQRSHPKQDDLPGLSLATQRQVSG